METQSTEAATKSPSWVNAAQSRLFALESDARKAFTELVGRSEKLTRSEIDQLLARVERSDSMRRMGKLWRRRNELGDKAEGIRRQVIGRLDTVSQKALSALNTATQEQLDSIGTDLERLQHSIGKVARRVTMNS